MPARSVVADGLERRLAEARETAAAWLLDRQHPDGYWVGELEGDTILESEYILLLTFIDRLHDPRVSLLANYLREKQNPDGSWSLYPGGPGDVSGSVKAYFALKLAGISPDEPFMLRARDIIRELGGIESCNSFTKIYLAIFGQLPWSEAPAVPPEIILLPRWAYFNIYAISAWSRTILVPLAIVWAKRPTCVVPETAGLGELFTHGSPPPRPRHEAAPGPSGAFWKSFFLMTDRLLKACESAGLTPLRGRALKVAEAWMLERFDRSGGLGAIFPPMIYAVMALRCLGYSDDHPSLVRARTELEAFEVRNGETLRMQPCFSPVWDTALCAFALSEAALPPDDPALSRATQWLLDREVRNPGDWKLADPKSPVGGWYFEFANEFYPDVDDTAMVLLALARNGARDSAGARRGLEWLLAMQNRDGGWSSFDRNNNRRILCHMPFADHNAMIDPSTADITGRVLEMLAPYGYGLDHPAVRRALAFLRREQEHDGSWYGRWGCNYLYGTWQVLKGLHAIGEDMSQDYVVRAAVWIRANQNADGGWGETPRSYDHPKFKAAGPSTVSQTAWALMALFATGDLDSLAVTQGLEYLLDAQTTAGTWEETHFTGTGFPRVFYLRYHLYCHYFPLMALGMYERRRGPE